MNTRNHNTSASVARPQPRPAQRRTAAPRHTDPVGQWMDSTAQRSLRGADWTRDDDVMLAYSLHRGYTNVEIADGMRRTEYGVRSRIDALRGTQTMSSLRRLATAWPAPAPDRQSRAPFARKTKSK